MSGKLDIVIEQGAKFVRTVQIKDKDGTVVDITGDTFDGNVRKRHNSTTETLSINTSIIDGANGKIELSIVSSFTAAVEAGECVYDIIWTPSYDNDVRLLEGIATVTPGVTR